MKQTFYFIVISLFLNSCSTKKEILYMQDLDAYNNTVLNQSYANIQPNDILKITVSAFIQETATPYNRPVNPERSGSASSELLKLDGYVVTQESTINFPVLGILSTANKTVLELQNEIAKILEDGGDLKNPTVSVRVLNSKITILGEVNSPGTVEFPENSITLLQALGYAGDLTINGKREDITIIRESDNVRKISHIDLTSAEFLNSPFYHLKANDVIFVNPNGPKVKTAGYINNPVAVLSFVSLIFSTYLLFTK